MQDKIKEVMDAVFKFKPGDIVTTRALVMRWKTEHEISGPRERYSRGAAPTPITIVCRELEECHGGYQPKYVARDEARPDILLRFMDHELVEYREGVEVALAMKPEPRKSDDATEPP